MLWIPFVLAPIVLGILVAVRKITIRSLSFLLTAFGVTLIESLVLAGVLDDWRMGETIPVLIFGVFAPWTIVAGLAYASPTRIPRGVVALGLPVIYFVLVAGGLGVADMLGMLRH